MSNSMGVLSQEGGEVTLRFERLLPGPIERVWAFLAESEKRAKWLAGGPMDLRVGGSGELCFRHADLTPHAETAPERFCKYEPESRMAIRITRCEPPRVLAHTWGGVGGDCSEVTFELTPQDNKVLLVLTHRRLTRRAELQSVAPGWHTHLELLVAHLEQGDLPPFWSTFTRLEEAYGKRLPESG